MYIKCEYDMGSYYITKALNYENGDNKDSLNRIIKYNNYLYNSQFQKSILVLHKQANEMSERLNIVTQNYPIPIVFVPLMPISMIFRYF